LLILLLVLCIVIQWGPALQCGAANTAAPTLFVSFHHYLYWLNWQCSQCIGGTDMLPPLVMKMPTGSTNKHISQILFVLAAKMYLWEIVSCTNTNGA
jgi:hypothetical protein